MALALKDSSGSIDSERLRAELASGAAFAQVSIHDDSIEYRLQVFIQEVAGKRDRQLRLDYAVTWNDELIKRFQDSLRVRQDEPLEPAITRILLSRLFALGERHAFSAPVLHEAVGASDYERELVLSAGSSGFELRSRHDYHHPLLGVSARYAHPSEHGGRIDVYVYPIREVGWQGALVVPTLEREAVRVRRDMHVLEERDVWAQFKLNPEKIEHWPTRDGRSAPVLYFEGEFADKDYQPFDTYSFLSLRADKYVKVRATIARNSVLTPDVRAIAQELLAHIDVPGESVFMRRVRNGWRDSIGTGVTPTE